MTYDLRDQEVGWQYNAGRDIHITNVHSWDGLAEQMDKIHAEIAQAHKYQAINAEQDAAIQSQLARIGIEMRNHNHDQEVIMDGLYEAQSQVDAASMELVQKIAQCTLEIAQLQQQLDQAKSANSQTWERGEQASQISQMAQKITRRSKTRSTLLTGMAGLVALAFDLGLTGGLVIALSAFIVVD
ncbi:MAG: hypothetical protein DYG89_34910 [Caldilinea sp. CFX5]|nr:hypothetical protein [Caldilinea sp. CFX5]